MHEPSSDETLEIIRMFKNSNPKAVIKYIKDKKIDPSYSDEIISDYAALHLRDDLIIGFFKDIQELGGNPCGHESIFKNLISTDKINGFKYLIDHEDFKKINYNFLYIVNTACMRDKDVFLELLDKKLDLFDMRMVDETNPSFINVSLSYLSPHVLNYFLPKYKEKVFNCIRNSEAIKKLESSLKEKDEVLIFANMYIKKLSKFSGLKEDIKIKQIEDLQEAMVYFNYKSLDKKISAVVKKPKTKKIWFFMIQ